MAKQKFGLALTLFISFGLAACSIVPAGGPSGNDVISGSSQPDAHYILIPITDQVVEQIATRQSQTFSRRFGDYRGPSTQIIGVGDVIQITIWEASSGGLFSTPTTDRFTAGSRSATIPDQVVSQDGTVAVPYAGRIHVIGLRPPDVEREIVNHLQGKAIDPQALVTVTHNLSSTVTVTGEVTAGARVPLSPKGDRILDVIASAGGVRAPAHASFIVLDRGTQSARVPMQLLLDHPKENIFVRPNDTLTVVLDPQSFTAVGATGRNAVVPFDAVGITLEEAVGKAGGLLDERADPYYVFVLRYETGLNLQGLTPASYSANTLVPVVYQSNWRDPSSLFRARRFPMQNKDILVVSNSPIAELQKILQLVATLTQPGINGVSASAGFK